MLLLRSLLFDFLMYVLMILMGIVCLPYALLSIDNTYKVMKAYVRIIFWLLRVLCGLKTEIRGTVPEGQVVVASKHQSFLDIYMLFDALPRGKFIMKKSLRWAPVIGQYGTRIGSIPVDRGKKSAAMKDMVSKAEANEDPGQTIIYPQGTRVAPGVEAPYKIGAAVLCKRLNQPCVPAATNAGVFWGRNSLYRRPGVAVVEFLEPIPAGMEIEPLIEELKSRIEPASERLLKEAQS